MRVDLHPPRPLLVELVARALTEDLAPLGDLTAALLAPDLTGAGSFTARRSGVVAGAACVDEVFAQLDPAVCVRWQHRDGDAVDAGARIADIDGPLRSILTGERTALNFLGHLSGVATLTRAFVDAVEATGSDTRVWDTRKTTPGLRGLEKAAVRAGGGANHRGNLSEWVMLKDNHLARVGLTDAVRAARAAWPGRTVHVECDRLEQVIEAVAAGAGAVLLDNMSPEQVGDAVAAVDAAVAAGAARPLVEVSGGVTLDTVAALAMPGVDCISVGALTNSAPVLDIGLDLAP